MKPVIQNLVAVAAVVIILTGMKAASGMLNQVLIALLLSMCIIPLPTWLIKKGAPRWLAIVIALVVILIGGLGFSALLAKSISDVVASLPKYEEKVTIFYHEFLDFAASNNLDISELLKKANIGPQNIIGAARAIVNILTGFISASFVISLLIAFMVIELVTYSDSIKKGKIDEIMAVSWIHDMGGDLRMYVNITSLGGVLTAVLNFFLLLILGVDFPFLWAVLSFLLNFVPNIGFIISFIPPALLALVDLGVTQALIVSGGFWLINALVENVFRPIFMKESLNISLLTIFLSLLFWGYILGLPGAVLGVPLTLVVIKIFKGMGSKEVKDTSLFTKE
ncbi:MAG: AI-2E family transporter [Bacteroidales bacterium]|nr:AI-2E family transporter [Bacteroidales bacterium]